jgi:hypothetical protein
MKGIFISLDQRAQAIAFLARHGLNGIQLTIDDDKVLMDMNSVITDMALVLARGAIEQSRAVEQASTVGPVKLGNPDALRQAREALEEMLRNALAERTSDVDKL